MPDTTPQPSRREQRLITIKEPNYHAKREEVIAGNLKRGNDGKFASVNGGSGSANPIPSVLRPKPKKGRKRRAAKPKKAPKVKLTPEQRKQQRDAAKQQQREQNRSTAVQALAQSDEMNPGAAKALLKFADNGGEDPQYTDGLVKSGLMERGEDGKPRLSATGRAAVNALNRGDARGAADRLSKGQSTAAAQRQRAAARQQRLAERQRKQTEREQKKREREAKRQPRRQARRPTPAPAPASPFRVAGKAHEPSSFTVFKDAHGAYRWLALSSNAYQDRDGEIVSTKALEADVARADADKSYGPLRWWHVGQPDPFNAVAPWGPGADLGMCDFNAMSGRVLIESGTFATPQIGMKVAAHADKLGVSIGFIHPLGQPDASGVFSDIRRFERSLAPRERVSNPFTTLTVSKELRPMDQSKMLELKALGFTDAEIASVVSRAQTTEKTADTQGVRFKADDMTAMIAQVTSLKALGLSDEQVIGAMTALKAPFPPIVEDEKAPIDTADVLDETVDAEPIDGDNMLNPGEIKAIADAVVAALGPLLGMEAKIGKMMDEFKTSVSGIGGAVATKDSEIADLKTQIADAQQRLKTLEGDQPAIGSNRASESNDAAAMALMLKQAGVGTSQPTNTQDMFAEWIISGQPPTAQ